MHQTTAAIHAIFLALALLASQSWGYFATPQSEDRLVIEQSDIEPNEEGDSLLELMTPPKPNKESEVRTAPPKTPKESTKLAAYTGGLSPFGELFTCPATAQYAKAGLWARPPTSSSSGYPYSHGNRGPPSTLA